MGTEEILSEPVERSLAKNAVDVAFNRAGVFSVAECEAAIRWAEVRRTADLAKIDHEVAWGEGRVFTRRYRQFIVPPRPGNRRLADFRRKLRDRLDALNRQIWRFRITDFGDLSVVRYEAKDEVGLHMDLALEYGDRKLAALVQLSPADAYEGGRLEFGLPPLAACREQGSLLVFPAWVAHRVTAVSSGVRYAAVCMALGPSFR